jgi:hypothetical protein
VEGASKGLDAIAWLQHLGDLHRLAKMGGGKPGLATDVTADAKALKNGGPFIARCIAEAIEHRQEDLGRGPDVAVPQQLLGPSGISQVSCVKVRIAGPGSETLRDPRANAGASPLALHSEPAAPVPFPHLASSRGPSLSAWPLCGPENRSRERPSGLCLKPTSDQDATWVDPVLGPRIIVADVLGPARAA